MKLIDGLQFGDFEKEGAVIESVDGGDGPMIVAGRTGMTRRELQRAVARAVAIVPGVGEMVLRIVRNRRINRLRERDTNAVFMNMEARRKGRIAADVAHALKATIGDRVRSPAAHAGDVELAV